MLLEVCVIATTNRREDLDNAVLSRFSSQYLVPLPGVTEREAVLATILKTYFTEHPIHRTVDMEVLQVCSRHFTLGQKPSALQIMVRSALLCLNQIWHSSLPFPLF